MKRIDLCGAWQGTGYDPDSGGRICFAGTVPGCVHTDLTPDYLPENLFWRDQAKQAQWIERWNWTYTKRFELDELGARPCLCFEGLDCECSVWLNGVCLGECADMFIPHTFDAGEALKLGENLVEVRFLSPVRRTETLPVREAAFTAERLYSRRMQCTYGWDWVARFVTCGIWRPVTLLFGDEMRVRGVSVHTKSIDSFSAQLVIQTEFECFQGGGIVDLAVYGPDSACVWSASCFCREAERTLYADIADPRLWYPHGYGGQPIYTLTVRCGSGEEFRQTFGIRTVKLLQLRDQLGSEAYQRCLSLKESASAREYDFNTEFSGFIVVVNGVRIMCKGANWVPCEPFPSAETDEKISRLLSLAREAGVNMLRVWGGGIFERQHFYGECDRLGIMVTQDFLMACGAYPEDEPWFIDALSREADYAARALRNHPCLMWWTGDNENAVKGNDLDSDYRGRASAYQGIAPALRRLDPDRPFLPSSPYGGNRYASKTAGTTHNTQYLSHIFQYFERGDLSGYKEYFKEYLARFIAEEPSMGAVSLPSLRRMMTEDEIFGEDQTMWRYHTQSNPALKRELFDYTQMFAEKVLGPFEDGVDRYFKLKYIQYEWIRVTLENCRRSQWFCGGIIYWMLDDCWPAASGWALIDYYGLPKASYYSFKRCAKPLLASIDREGDTYAVSVSNDSQGGGQVKASLSLLDLAADVIKPLAEITADIPAGGAQRVLTWQGPAPEGQILICQAESPLGSDRAFYKDGGLALTPSGAVQVVSREPDAIRLRAERYVHAVELEGDAVFSDNYFSLLPQEEVQIGYSPLTPSEAPEIQVRAYTIKAGTE